MCNESFLKLVAGSLHKMWVRLNQPTNVFFVGPRIVLRQIKILVNLECFQQSVWKSDDHCLALRNYLVDVHSVEWIWQLVSYSWVAHAVR
jgi:hypothetical protein